jgi:hypothetical protein
MRGVEKKEPISKNEMELQNLLSAYSTLKCLFLFSS